MISFPYFSIRWKLLAAFIGMVLVIVMVMLYSIGSIVEDRIRENINKNFAEAGRVFERIQEVRFRQLRQTGILVSETPQLKAAVSTGDSTTINLLLRDDLRYLLDFDPIIPDSLIPAAYFEHPDSAGLLLITDNTGLPIGQMSTRPMPRFSIADRPGISDALRGKHPEQAFIWESDGRNYNVITVPIFIQDHLQGTLSYGFPMRQQETEQLSYDIGMEISYFVNNRVIASSIKGDEHLLHETLGKQIHNATYEVDRTGEAAVLEFRLYKEDWLMYLAPMHTDHTSGTGISGYYVVARSLTAELETLQSIQTLIFILGIGGILGATFVSFWVTGRITKPISMLVEGVQRLENQDFSREVPVTTNDELGKLTVAFNNMTKGLQERLMMLKFVSQATLDAVKNNLTRIDPGGERRDVAVFFSDIRGFTTWSENRTPDEVIDMLNGLFALQADIIQNFGGDIDKFVGDELVAVFQGEDKEQKAVEAAISIQKSIKNGIKNPEHIALGIGINSGEVVMGAMGSKSRMDYTVLGSNVNLGARLCSSAQSDQILISDQVFLKLERRIAVNTFNVNAIKLKGFEHPIQVHEVVWSDIPETVTD